MRAIRALDAAGLFAAPPGELSIAFLPADEMGRLHERFMGDPAPTDVITFDGDPALGIAGEICVCPDVARDFIGASGGDFAAELCLYVVHGYLHLAGFGDKSPARRRHMRAAERAALGVLRNTAGFPKFVLWQGRRSRAKAGADQEVRGAFPGRPLRPPR